MRLEACFLALNSAQSSAEEAELGMGAGGGLDAPSCKQEEGPWGTHTFWEAEVQSGEPVSQPPSRPRSRTRI